MVVDRRCFIDLCIRHKFCSTTDSWFDRVSQYCLVPIRVVQEEHYDSPSSHGREAIDSLLF